MKAGWVLAPLALITVLGASRMTVDFKALEGRMHSLRKLDDTTRVGETKSLALEIRDVSDPEQKLNLALGLANLSTEGDFGRDTLQEVTTTLEIAVKGDPSSKLAEPAYDELAQLSKYEGMKTDQSNPELAKALSKLDAEDQARAQVDFSLTDLSGKAWKLSDLKGKVVLVNFWATWCPPCRKEMPDLQTLYSQFKGKGFVVLAISDEKLEKVQPFIQKAGYTFPVMLDNGRIVNTAYGVQGIPKSFIYDRDGKLVAQTIDMRTKQQFLNLLAKAGLN